MPTLPQKTAYKLLINREQIAERIAILGREIALQIKPEERPLAIVVLQGAFVFAADLIRAIPAELGLEVAFLRCESYGHATQSSGKVALTQDLDESLDLQGRTALLIDDILDTGLTLRFLTEHLRKRGAQKIEIAVLLRRKARKPEQQLTANFVGFDVDDDFFVGYGLDHAGQHRNLPDLMGVAIDD